MTAYIPYVFTPVFMVLTLLVVGVADAFDRRRANRITELVETNKTERARLRVEEARLRTQEALLRIEETRREYEREESQAPALAELVRGPAPDPGEAEEDSA